MKSILLSFASLLVTVSAFAMPSVGDQALYNVTTTQGGQTHVGTVETSILSLDSSNGLFNVQTIFNFNGQSQAQTELRGAQDMVTDQMAADLVANCASYQGRPETVTVPAGTFQTCALPTGQSPSTGTIWIATGVAFGVVKGDMTENGSHNYVELQSFKNGN